jgi:hypothetical protein
VLNSLVGVEAQEGGEIPLAVSTDFAGNRKSHDSPPLRGLVVTF